MEIIDTSELETYQGGSGKTAIEDPDFFQFVIRNFSKIKAFFDALEEAIPDCAFSIGDYPAGHEITLDECGYLFTN